MALTGTLRRTLAVVGLCAAALLGSTALPDATPAQAATFFTIVGQGSNKCLDIRSEDGGGPGSRAQIWTCFGSANQRFALVKAGTTAAGRPYFQIVNKAAPYLCLQVRGSSTANGAQVDQVGCSQDGNQFWYWGSPNSGYYLPLVNVYSGKCLDVNGGSTANGARVQQWTCNATSAQMWKTVQ